MNVTEFNICVIYLDLNITPRKGFVPSVTVGNLCPLSGAAAGSAAGMCVLRWQTVSQLGFLSLLLSAWVKRRSDSSRLNVSHLYRSITLSFVPADVETEVFGFQGKGKLSSVWIRQEDDTRMDFLRSSIPLLLKKNSSCTNLEKAKDD